MLLRIIFSTIITRRMRATINVGNVGKRWQQSEQGQIAGKFYTSRRESVRSRTVLVDDRS